MKTLLRLFTALSTLLCLAAAILWVRSYRISDMITYNRTLNPASPLQIRQYTAFSARGRLVFYRITWSAYRTHAAPPLPTWTRRHSIPADPALVVPGYAQGVGRLGFRIVHTFHDPASLCIVIPLWAILLAAALLPARFLLIFRQALIRRHRRKHNLCLHCAYDLRASKGRCPECGFPIPIHNK